MRKKDEGRQPEERQRVGDDGCVTAVRKEGDSKGDDSKAEGFLYQNSYCLVSALSGFPLFFPSF